MATQCVVTARDYRQYWKRQTPPAPVFQPPTYTGPERRMNAHDRRWLNGVGGRRRFDRKDAR